MIILDKKISDHFSGYEFKCPHCGAIKIDEELITKVEHIFKKVHASKCIVSSGYRCIKYDISENGFAGRHSEGLAMDCCFYDTNGKIIPSKYIICVAFELGELNGIARIDNNYIHLDNRKNSTYYGDETLGNSSFWKNPYTYFNVSKMELLKYTHNDISRINYQVHSIEDKIYYSNVIANSTNYAGLFGKTMDGVLIDKLIYKVRIKNGLFNKWLPEVKGREDYAGIYNKPINAIAIKNAKYRVHIKNGDWLPVVDGYNTKDSKNGYAGNGKEIDALQILEIMI